MIGCARKIVLLVVLLFLVGGAWFFRDSLRMKWRELRGAPPEQEASRELADQALAKLAALEDGSTEQAALSAAELESLLFFEYRGLLPAFLDSPQVEMHDDQLQLRARVPIDKLPRVDGLGEAASFLPDTADLLVAGKLLPLDSGRVGFAVDEVSAARFPVPSRMIPRALQRMGRRDEPGLPADAMALRLPGGAAAAYIRRDSLVLLARPRAIH
jgi:hypothetical protein